MFVNFYYNLEGYLNIKWNFVSGTEDIYYKTDEQVIAKYGKKYTWDLRMKILGCSEQTTAETLVSELKLPITPTKYNEEVKKILKKTLKEASLMPGNF